MGFDLHGRGPFSTEPPEYPEDEDFQATEEYHQNMRIYERDNPGYYFHNNVWWWRPLWEFVCHACDDIITIKDAHSGNYNDGHLINKKKALALSKRIEQLHKDGNIQEYLTDRKKHIEELPLVRCDICEGTGYRNLDDSIVSTVCNACNGKKERPDFQGKYTLDLENILAFVKFAKKSGGFEIS